MTPAVLIRLDWVTPRLYVALRADKLPQQVLPVAEAAPRAERGEAVWIAAADLRDFAAAVNEPELAQ